MVELHKFVKKGETRIAGHTYLSEYINHNMVQKMDDYAIGSLFKLYTQGRVAKLDLVSYEAPRDNSTAFFLKTHKGVVAFAPEKYETLMELLGEIDSHSRNDNYRSRKAGNILKGVIGVKGRSSEKATVDGIDYSLAAASGRGSPTMLRLSYEAAKKELRDSKPGKTYTGTDGSEYIKLESGEVIDMPFHNIWTQYLGE